MVAGVFRPNQKIINPVTICGSIFTENNVAGPTVLSIVIGPYCPDDKVIKTVAINIPRRGNRCADIIISQLDFLKMNINFDVLISTHVNVMK